MVSTQKTLFCSNNISSMNDIFFQRPTMQPFVKRSNAVGKLIMLGYYNVARAARERLMSASREPNQLI